MRETIPATHIGGKESPVAKDSEKNPAARLNQIQKEWGLSDKVDESTAKAQAQALVPLQKWLATGAKSPNVVIRSVQVLLADPEIPGVDQRTALNEVSTQLSETWAKVGQGQEGVLGLQAMLLAAWPHESRQGNFALAPLLDSAWSAVKGRDRCRSRLDAWRRSLLHSQTGGSNKPQAARAAAPKVSVQANGPAIAAVGTAMTHLRSHAGARFYEAVGSQLATVLEAHNSDIQSLFDFVNVLPEPINNALSELKSQISSELIFQQALRTETEFLWWGQARYSQALRIPYRRIKNPDERLWWMAWESSQLARHLDAEPAASFLVETLDQVGDDITEKRSLKDWIQALISTLRNAKNLHVGNPLAELASEDPLGLPVTWARLEVADSEFEEAALEEKAREKTGLSLDVELDRGDWAAWVFRECLLDRHLGAQ